MKHIILKIKYDNKREYIEGFAKLMAIRYEKFIKVSNIDCIIPVPLHSSRKKMRGFNQDTLTVFFTLQRQSKYLDLPVFFDCLCRVKKTKDQKGLNRTERLHNLDNAFMVRDLPPNIKNILIVDDVYTTGTTIEKCAKVLKDSGINKIYFLTICTGSIS